MIAHLKGILMVKDADSLVVDVGGVGYAVTVSASTFALLPPEGETAALHIHAHTHERGMELYGFHSIEERQVFRLLLNVSGIGPKVAVSILSTLEAADLARAVSREDVASLTAVPGIGKKTARRMCVELKESLSKLSLVWHAESPDAESEAGGESSAETAKSRAVSDIRSALCNMGYRVTLVDAIMPEVRRSAAAGAELNDLLKLGLSLLRRPA